MLFHDLVEENGRTIRENNFAREHKFPLGTLVEVQWNEWLGEGACWTIHARLWIVNQYRDYDGSPLYRLGEYKTKHRGEWHGKTFNPFSEGQLRTVELTEDVRTGEVVPDWLEEEDK